MNQEILILDNHQVTQKINRIAYQLYETFVYQENVIMVGIAGQGYQVAEKIADKLRQISDLTISLEKLTFTKQNPTKDNYEYTGDTLNLANACVVLVDDVLNSGSTLIYGVKYLLKQPVKHLVTTVLVDRIHRKFPVKADFVGLSLATTLQENIDVRFNHNQETLVYLQ
jgi:pyrimidine operon attenuation protein/uracil phosphoribosyltransferase